MFLSYYKLSLYVLLSRAEIFEHLIIISKIKQQLLLTLNRFSPHIYVTFQSECAGRGHLDMWTGAAWDWTTNPDGLPAALPSEL